MGKGKVGMLGFDSMIFCFDRLIWVLGVMSFGGFGDFGFWVFGGLGLGIEWGWGVGLCVQILGFRYLHTKGELCEYSYNSSS